MIFLSVLLYALSFDGAISRIDGIILFSMALAYVGYLVRQSKREKDGGVLSEYEEEFGKAGEDPKWLKNIALVIFGIGGLVLGSKWLVDSAEFIATAFGVSELIIGLTIVSLGTSLPEVATSVVAALKGERDIAVGNVVGSNIFNIVTVLGISSIVAPAGIAVAKAALDFDMLVMIAVALATLPVFFYGYRISRMAGFFFLLFYGAYLVHIVLESHGQSRPGRISARDVDFCGSGGRSGSFCAASPCHQAAEKPRLDIFRDPSRFSHPATSAPESSRICPTPRINHHNRPARTAPPEKPAASTGGCSPFSASRS